MLVKTLIKNSVAVGLTTAGVALHAGWPGSTAFLAALAASGTTFLILPPALKLVKQIPDGFKRVRTAGSDTVTYFRKKASLMANRVNPADPDQNVLLGLTSGFLASQAFASTVDPLVNAGIDALPVGKPMKAILRHPREIATVSLTVAGGLAGYVFSDKRVKENLETTSTVITQHAAASETGAAVPRASGTASSTVGGAVNSVVAALGGGRKPK